MSEAAHPTLAARTVALDLDLATGLLELMPAPTSQRPASAWLRRGEGFVAWGEAAAVRPSGADRFDDADAWWRAVSEAADVCDDVGLPGTGLVAFGSFAFADDPGASTLIVPEVISGTTVT